MAKTIKSIGFTQNDEALVEKITIYQKKNSLSFYCRCQRAVRNGVENGNNRKKAGVKDGLI